MIELARIFLAKAEESLEGGESEFVNGRYNNCAKGCYYACFQGAVHALIQEGIEPRAGRGHNFVQSVFVGQLLNRRSRYPSALRDVLIRGLELRQAADYREVQVTEIQAARALQRARALLEAVRPRGETA